MKHSLRVLIPLFFILLFACNNVFGEKEGGKLQISYFECIERGGSVKEVGCGADQKILGEIKGGEFPRLCCRYYEENKDLTNYLKQSDYCEKDAECVIRLGACGGEPMNVYFDNRQLIEMQPFVECSEYISLRGRAKCDSNKCVGVEVPDGPSFLDNRLKLRKIPDDEQVMCAMDAKLCPDGSYVGRIPPSCEFRECLH